MKAAMMKVPESWKANSQAKSVSDLRTIQSSKNKHHSMRTFIHPNHMKANSNSRSNFWANGNSSEVLSQERVNTANWNENSTHELPRHVHQGSGTYILEQADNDSHNSGTEEYQLQDNSKYSVEDIKLTI